MLLYTDFLHVMYFGHQRLLKHEFWHFNGIPWYRCNVTDLNTFQQSLPLSKENGWSLSNSGGKNSFFCNHAQSPLTALWAYWPRPPPRLWTTVFQQVVAAHKLCGLTPFTLTPARHFPLTRKLLIEPGSPGTPKGRKHFPPSVNQSQGLFCIIKYHFVAVFYRSEVFLHPLAWQKKKKNAMLKLERLRLKILRGILKAWLKHGLYKN